MALQPRNFEPRGKLPFEIQQVIWQLFSQIDKCVQELAILKGISMRHVRMNHPLKYCVYVTQYKTYVFATDKNVGSFTLFYSGSYEHPDINRHQIVKELEDHFGYEDVFSFDFPTSYLRFESDEEKIKYASIISEQYLEDVQQEIILEGKMMKQKSIFAKNEFIINEKLVFVVCPFKEPFNAIYEDHIKTLVEKDLNMQCQRADEVYSNGPIIDDIWRLINEAKLIIADLTGRNPNVFYEVGLAHAIGKEVILITQNVDDIPFDLRHLRTVIYKEDYRGQIALYEDLKKKLQSLL
jgi:hypothetical protein